MQIHVSIYVALWQYKPEEVALNPAVTVESTASYQGAGIMISTVCGCAQSWDYAAHFWNPQSSLKIAQ